MKTLFTIEQVKNNPGVYDLIIAGSIKSAQFKSENGCIIDTETGIALTEEEYGTIYSNEEVFSMYINK